MRPSRHREEPIVAVATAAGRGAIGIVRLSGRSLRAFSRVLCGIELKARQATLCTIADADGTTVDRVLALFFEGPNSYTGEDVLELHGHGGPVVLQMLVARCLAVAASADPSSGLPRLSGLRPAAPGEFTERAFWNDKLDLAQAEAVADLIDASTQAAARSAARSLEGALSNAADALAEETVSLRVLVEATLDFPDEEIEFLERAGARERLQALRDRLAGVAAAARRGALLREGLRVVIAGQPNAGKSSLRNALAGSELAIVTPLPGTTRDRIGETIAIEGVPIHIVDTAGLRDGSDDAVEQIGIARAWQAIADADVIVFVHDLARQGDAGYVAADADIAARIGAAGATSRVLDVDNKIDLVGDTTAHRAPVGETGLRVPASRRDACDRVAVSAVSGEGLDHLRRALLVRAGWQPGDEGVFIARARHLDALARAAAHLEAAARHAEVGDAALELVAEELRLGHDAIAEITGRTSADDLLGAIFSRFCIGK